MHIARGRLLTLLGLALGALGIVAFVIQIVGLHWLAVPWYMPVLAFLGAVLVGVSLRERSTVGRILAMVALLTLGGLQGTALYVMRLPPYAGPIALD